MLTRTASGELSGPLMVVRKEVPGTLLPELRRRIFRIGSRRVTIVFDYIRKRSLSKHGLCCLEGPFRYRPVHDVAEHQPTFGFTGRMWSQLTVHMPQLCSPLPFVPFIPCFSSFRPPRS